MCTKIVNDDYKEVKKIKVPKAGANIDHLIETLRSEPRWHKAVMHLREKNELKGELSDLGLLVKEVMNDIEKEEKETLKEELWKLFRKNLLQGSTKGIYQYYNDLLVKDSKNE